VAAVFAIHPLRVESVAWVAERKDVLSGVFFMLTLWAYVRYARKQWSLLNYLAVVFLFALGLMSKPMLVTLPFVLLLLDYWPLGRFENPNHLPEFFSIPRHLILEKITLLALAAADCVVTVLSQHGAIVLAKSLPLAPRLENATLSCAVYLRQMFYPAKLALFYLYASDGPLFWKSIFAFLLLAAITAVVFMWRKKRPFILVGWFWYLGMLVPVIGLIQVGQQSHADRYTYLPQIGLYLMLAWAAADFCAGWRHRRMVLGGTSAVILAALVICARAQATYWKNSETLWIRTLACTSNSAIAHDCLGNALLKKERVNEAIVQCRMALEIEPDYAEAYFDLGNALMQKGELDEAIAHWQKAVQFKPDYSQAYHNLGVALLQKGRVNEAIAQLQKAVEIKSDDAEGYYSLGVALFQNGQVSEAIAQWQKALEIKPDYAEACNNLGMALVQKGRLDEAITYFQKALEIEPDFASARANLNNALLTRRPQ
jgi:tetratricopeptide (TPR) repeat protein